MERHWDTMRICETCGKTFEDDKAVCPKDGSALLEATDEQIGTTIDRYILVKRLGKGSMGSVYLGVHPVIRSRVAIKVLHSSSESSPTEFKRFVLEAKAVNRINHPNIVQIMDMGQLPDGRPFILMEHLEGSSLRSRMIRPPLLEPEEAQGIVEQVLSALQAAHDAGFVHRDLKPDNIFVTSEGLVKLLDFGIAKLLDQTEKGFSTQDGAVVGTPMYLAPEQALGEHSLIGPWTDLYSMGGILYEMYTGRSLFKARNVGSILLAHAQETPALPSESNSQIPPSLDRVILWCLEKSHTERPQSATQLLEVFSDASLEYASGVASTLPGATLPEFSISTGGSSPDSKPGSRGPGSSARGQVTGPFPAEQREQYREKWLEAVMSSQDAGGPTSKIDMRRRPGARAVRPWKTMAISALLVLAVAALGGLLWSRLRQRPDSGSKMPPTPKVGTTPSRPAVQPSGKLVVLQPFQADYLDPTKVTNAEAIDIVNQTHEPLVAYDSLTGQVQPCLATSWTRQGNTYIFKIRPGVRFHDGSLLTAEKVVQSLRRSLRSELGKAYLDDVQDLAKSGEMEVSIRIARPSGSFLVRLSVYPFLINVPGERYPAGTGPYRVKAWNRGVGAVILAPHLSYWGGTPRLQTIVFKAEPDARARASLLIQGSAHLATALPVHITKTLESRKDIHVVQSSMSFVTYLKFNTRKPYLRDPRTRKAISLAVDRDSLVSQLFEGSGTKAETSVPPNLLRSPMSKERVAYDPARAKALLKRSPVAGRVLTLYLYSDPRPYLPDPKLAARILRRGFAAAGLKVKTVLMSYTAARQACSDGKHDLMFYGWALDYPDPENIYFLISRKGRASGNNFSFFDDPEFEKLLGQAKREQDHNKRTALFLRLESIVREKRPWLPLFYISAFTARRSEVRGAGFDVSGAFSLNLKSAFLKP